MKLYLRPDIDAPLLPSQGMTLDTGPIFEAIAVTFSIEMLINYAPIAHNFSSHMSRRSLRRVQILMRNNIPKDASHASFMREQLKICTFKPKGGAYSGFEARLNLWIQFRIGLWHLFDD